MALHHGGRGEHGVCAPGVPRLRARGVGGVRVSDWTTCQRRKEKKKKKKLREEGGADWRLGWRQAAVESARAHSPASPPGVLRGAARLPRQTDEHPPW